MLKSIITLLFVTSLFGGDYLTCSEQNKVFLKFSTKTVTGGKQTLRYNTSTGRFFMDKEYGGQSHKIQSIRFKNMTGRTYDRTYKVGHNTGWAIIIASASTSVTNYNQVRDLLSCKYKIIKTGGWPSRTVYEFYD